MRWRRIYAKHESLGDRNGRDFFANCIGRGLRLERLSDPACTAIRMEHSRSHVNVYHQHLRAGCISLLRWPLAESSWPTHRRTDRWRPLWSWSLPGQLLRPWAVVVVSELWSDRRNWFGLQLHRACRCARQVVPGP